VSRLNPNLRARSALPAGAPAAWAFLFAIPSFYWAAGMVVYAVTNFFQHGLMLLDVIETPDSLGRSALHWHFFFWAPWWLLGGVLFVVARSAPSLASRAEPAVN
jgi:hypothetical protein